ncbi:MAG: D-glycero-alpha-D-manno-heptose-1,7-bisphosphate 7-phosphatase [Chloroflexota bacterium]|nr:HAD family hydrolase [Lentimicrobium sp.]
MFSKAVFFDKDGTLIPDIPYNVDPAIITLADGADELLKRLSGKSFRFIVVSNQSGIARGYFKEEDLAGVKAKLESLFIKEDSHLDGFYYCPHYPMGIIEQYSRSCDCRKPQPGMLIKAARDLQLDLQASWFIGDILNDVEAGNRAGCKTILLDNGNETEWIEGEFRKPDFIIKNLREAADIIESNLWNKLTVKA